MIAGAYFFMIMKKIFNYFSLSEKLLWIISIILISSSHFIFGGDDLMTFLASIIGVSSLIFNAKGNPIGQALMIVFSVFYGIISYGFNYYGEMLTYLGMTAPMALFALISWLKNPYKGKRSEVKINDLSYKEVPFMIFLTLIISIAFYFVLKSFKTSNLVLSTVSVFTSFLAVYLTFRRSPFFALLYALNDIVLIVLWILASIENSSYISVTVCFAVFLINDLYGFFSWIKMRKRQTKTT